MTRYKIIIQYDGTNFSGFQSQKNKSGIQDKIESSILTSGLFFLASSIIVSPKTS